jgi:hypothetical protein
MNFSGWDELSKGDLEEICGRNWSVSAVAGWLRNRDNVQRKANL